MNSSDFAKSTPIDLNLVRGVAVGLTLNRDFLANARETGDSDLLCRALIVVATERVVYSYESSAVSMLDEAQDLLDGGVILEPEFYWHYLTSRGNLCYQLGQQAESLACHEAALECCRTHSLSFSLRRTLLNIGSLSLHVGDFPGAIRVVKDLLTLGAADSIMLKHARELVAEILQYDGVSDLAIHHYEVALSTYGPHETRRKFRLTQRLAYTYLDAENTDGARSCLSQLRRLEEARPRRVSPNPVLDSLESRILVAEGDNKAALVLAKLSRQLLCDSGLHTLAESATITIARIHLKRGEYDAVVALSASSTTKAFTATGVRSLLLMAGEAHELMGWLERAANVEQDAYRCTGTRSLELGPLLELVAAIKNLERLRERQEEIQEAAYDGARLVAEIEHMTELVVTDIGEPLEALQQLFDTGCEESETTDFQRVANSHLVEVETLLASAEEITSRSLVELGVPVTSIFERACRDLDQIAIVSRVTLEREQDNNGKVVLARWEILELLKSQLEAAIVEAPPETRLRIKPRETSGSGQPFTIDTEPPNY